MYEYIKGLLHSKTSEKAVVDVHGIGYLLSIPASTFARLPEKGEVFLYTALVVREDAHTLYGFATLPERSLFSHMRAISGIGPKTALCIVGQFDIALLQAAIEGEKPELLAKVPGIGLKTARRILIEMRDKIGMLSREREEASAQKLDPLSIDAIAALVHLGYPHKKAQKAVEAVRGEKDSLSLLIPAALKHI